MPTPDLAEVIALLRGSIISPDAKYRVSVKCADLTAILDAAEAGMNARSTIEELTCGDVNAAIRNEALEEAVRKIRSMNTHHNWSFFADVVERMKEKPNG